jgi:hypothetical protein
LRELAAARRRFGYRRLGYLLPRIADLPQQRLHELLPWNWKKQQNMAPGTP